MAVREDKMGQTQLLPTSLRDLVPEDHICNLVVAVVNSMEAEIEKAEEKFRGPGILLIRGRCF